MKLKEWLRERKEKRAERKLERLRRKAEEKGQIALEPDAPESTEYEAEELDRIDEAGETAEQAERKLMNEEPEFMPFEAYTEGIEQPESRFTEEYREFLKKQEAVQKGIEAETK